MFQGCRIDISYSSSQNGKRIEPKAISCFWSVGELVPDSNRARCPDSFGKTDLQKKYSISWQFMAHFVPFGRQIFFIVRVHRRQDRDLINDF